jgi:hypothetical protein
LLIDFDDYRYKYLTNVTQIHDESSYHRQSRSDQLPIALSSQAIQNILGDYEDKEYPIFRRGASPDTDVYTICSCVFNHVSKSVQIWCGSNPKETDACAVLPF